MNDPRATVVHIVQNLDVGGLERVVINLMEHADPERYRPVLVCLGSGGALVPEVRERGIPVYSFDKGSGMSYGVLWRLAGILRRERARIVHGHNLAPLTYGALAAKFTGVSGVVYTAHGAKTSGKRKQVWFQRLRLVDYFVYVSEDARRVAADAGISERGTVTIVNGIDVSRYGSARERDARRAEFGISADAPVVGIVARLTRAKDYPNLFRAFRIVAQEFPDARLLVVGDGELRAEVEAEIASLSLGKKVVLAGSRRDVPDLLAAMDVFALSSSTEGLAMTLLEAMAAGLPIVATSVGGNAEAVASGETGIIVPPRDPDALAAGILEILRDRALARRYGVAGKRRASERFSTQAMAAAYTRLYDRIPGSR